MAEVKDRKESYEQERLRDPRGHTWPTEPPRFYEPQKSQGSEYDFEELHFPAKFLKRLLVGLVIAALLLVIGIWMAI